MDRLREWDLKNSEIEKCIKCFEELKNNKSKISVYDFDKNDEYNIFEALEDFIHHFFKGFYVGRAYNYEREIHNISSNEIIMNEILGENNVKKDLT